MKEESVSGSYREITLNSGDAVETTIVFDLDDGRRLSIRMPSSDMAALRTHLDLAYTGWVDEQMPLLVAATRKERLQKKE